MYTRLCNNLINLLYIMRHTLRSKMRDNQRKRSEY